MSAAHLVDVCSTSLEGWLTTSALQSGVLKITSQWFSTGAKLSVSRVAHGLLQKLWWVSTRLANIFGQ